MIGKLVTRCVTLDYTAVSAPVSAEGIHDDITETQVHLFAEPEKIVLWEHQLDWIKKSIPGRYGTEYIWERVDLNVRTPAKPKGSPTTIWGVPIEVREP